MTNHTGGTAFSAHRGAGITSAASPIGHRQRKISPQSTEMMPRRNITEFQAQVAGAMGPNRSLQAGSIEPTSHGCSNPTGVR
jgi:hypothetical protein